MLGRSRDLTRVRLRRPETPRWQRDGEGGSERLRRVPEDRALAGRSRSIPVGRRDLEAVGVFARGWQTHGVGSSKESGSAPAGGGRAPPQQGSALELAQAVGTEAARRGFDWPDASGPLAKIEEELAELREAAEGGDRARVEAELGDLLFAVANAARHLEVCPETALRGTVARFRRRFDQLEASLAGAGRRPEDATLDELEAAWRAAKAAVG